MRVKFNKTVSRWRACFVCRLCLPRPTRYFQTFTAALRERWNWSLFETWWLFLLVMSWSHHWIPLLIRAVWTIKC